ncbi:MAG: hypothetical protein IKG01_07405 [Lachnospiraceae bacterium]|nr:hypothetical protein [Lachnospiraceae bacterium]
MGEQYDKAVSLDELWKANRQCKKGVADKDTPIEWHLHPITKCRKLQVSLEEGKYKTHRGTKVQIYRPKRREATAPAYADRVWQRSMCNNGVYDDLTRGFILDNMACQKGKGNDLAIRRVVRMLQKLHRKAPGQTVYGIHLDVKKFFPSTPHSGLKEMDRHRIRDPNFLPYLFEIIDNSADERPKEVIEADPFGERGTGLGSQINQLHQVAYLDKLDHELKCFCKWYIRYNDDFLILDHDKEIVRKARDTIEEWLTNLGLTMTLKQGIFKAEYGFGFLRKRFILTKTGKVIIRLHKHALADERNVLRAIHKRVVSGEETMDFVKRHYQSIVANFEYAGDAPIRAMDKFYTRLFRQKPEYKRKKRYLYGNYQERKKKTG